GAKEVVPELVGLPPSCCHPLWPAPAAQQLVSLRAVACPAQYEEQVSVSVGRQVNVQLHHSARVTARIEVAAQPDALQSHGIVDVALAAEELAPVGGETVDRQAASQEDHLVAELLVEGVARQQRLVGWVVLCDDMGPGSLG